MILDEEKNCTIELQDFKNVKFNNLAIEDRRACHNRLKFFDPKARYMPSVKLGRWDGSISFFSVGGQTYINFLPILVEFLTNKGYSFKIDDRRPNYTFSFDDIDENYLHDTKWPTGHPKEGEPIVLMDHQVKAVNSLIKGDSGILLAATSSGKSLICVALSKVMQAYGRTIIVVPTTDLVNQLYEDYTNCGLDVGRIMFGYRELSKQHTITTWQSLYAIKKKSSFEPLSADELAVLLEGQVCTIQDEVHLATSKAMFHINSFIFKNVPLCYGMTGTLPKEEHLRESLRANFGEVVYDIEAKELQEKGILANCHITCRQILLAKQTFKVYHDEKKFINTHQIALSQIANDIIEMSSGDKGNTLVLVENIEVGEFLQSIIPNSVFLSGSNSSKERKKEFKGINTDNNAVLIATLGIASTGISINRLFNLVLFNIGKAFTRTIQSIGRGLRIAQDKDFINIFDYSFNTKYSSRHLSERRTFYKAAGYPFNTLKIDLKEK